jgi:hypothetical protein
MRCFTEPYEIQARREDYDAELEGISMMAFNSTLTGKIRSPPLHTCASLRTYKRWMPGADEMMPQEALDAVKDMHERGDYRGVSRELERQIRSRLNMWHLHDPMHDPSNPRPEPKTVQVRSLATAPPCGAFARPQRLQGMVVTLAALIQL